MLTTARIRIVATLAGSVLTWQSVLLANEPTPLTPGDVQIDLWKWGVTQGGLLLCTLVILWSYRRDFLSRLAAKSSEIGVLSELVRSATAAQVELTAAVREQTRAIEYRRSRDD